MSAIDRLCEHLRANSHPLHHASSGQMMESLEACELMLVAAPNAEVTEALDSLICWIDGDYPDDTPEARRIEAAKLALAKARAQEEQTR